MKTTKEKAAETRRSLKQELNLGRADVSVRIRPCTYSYDINIVLKNTDAANGVALSKVETIANRQESIRRCEMSGEILGGGNTYVSVRRTDEATETLAGRFLNAVRRAREVLEDLDSSCLESIEGSRSQLSLSKTGCLNVWGEGSSPASVYSDKQAAEVIAERELER